MRWKGICAGLAVGIAAGLALGAVRVRGDEGESRLMVKEFFEPLLWIVRQIDRYYVEDVDHDTLLMGAYQGMIARADPGGIYLPAEMTAQYGPGADGTIPELGLKARFLPLQKAVVIDGTIPGRPAFQAGLLTGDYVLKVGEAGGGEAVDTQEFRTIFDAARALHGDAGTTVVLTVVRPNAGLARDVEVTRRADSSPRARLRKRAVSWLPNRFICTCVTWSGYMDSRSSMAERKPSAPAGSTGE